MANRIVGLKNIHIAKKTATGTYATPVKLEGAKTFNTTNEVSESSFYSDDVMDYYSKNITSMELEIELAYLKPEIDSLISGKEYINGVLLSGANDEAGEFAIMYEMATLKEPIRRVIYCSVLSKDEQSSSTKTDSVEEQLVKLTGKAKPDEDGIFDAVLDKNNIPTGQETKFNAIWDNFFDTVQTPTVIKTKSTAKYTVNDNLK